MREQVQPVITSTSGPVGRSRAESKAPAVNTERASEQYYIDCVTKVLEQLGWRNVGGAPAPGTAVIWSEDPAKKPRLLALPPGARTNRFFAMVRVCRKVPLHASFAIDWRPNTMPAAC